MSQWCCYWDLQNSDAYLIDPSNIYDIICNIFYDTTYDIIVLIWYHTERLCNYCNALSVCQVVYVMSYMILHIALTVCQVVYVISYNHTQRICNALWLEALTDCQVVWYVGYLCFPVGYQIWHWLQLWFQIFGGMISNMFRNLHFPSIYDIIVVWYQITLIPPVIW